MAARSRPGRQLSAQADVFNGDDGHLDFAATVDLTGGTAQPARSNCGLLAAGGLLCTADWRLSDCTARLHATRCDVTLESFTARHRHGKVAIEGLIETAAEPPELTFDVHLKDMESASTSSTCCRRNRSSRCRRSGRN